MNLSQSPRLSQLSALTSNLKNERCYYDLIVEHDGAVRFEPSPNKITDSQFRFCFNRCLQGPTKEEHPSKNLKQLNQLYKNISYCWENNMTGKIDPGYITSILNLHHRLEAGEAWEKVNVKPALMFTSGRSRRYAASL